MESRRQVLQKLSLAAALCAIPGRLRASEAEGKSLKSEDQAKAPPHEAVEEYPAPWELLSPLGPGSVLGHDWVLLAASPIRHGASVLRLGHKSGLQASVHLCRRDGASRGLTHSRYFDLLLMNGGNGDSPSEEMLGRVVVSLGDRIRKTEEAAVAARPELLQLMSHNQRLLAYRQARPEILC